jgi:hypothetical protein
MSEYAALKVPELKKLLQEKSLPVAGNKADLIARLQEHDKAAEPNKPGQYLTIPLRHRHQHCAPSSVFAPAWRNHPSQVPDSRQDIADKD